MKKFITIVFIVGFCFDFWSCGGKNNRSGSEPSDEATVIALEFNADSAQNFIEQQCQFGPRVLNTEAHELCGNYIISKFKTYGCKVTQQQTDFKRYDGKKMTGYNIIAETKPEAESRILIAAHWDSRPWADNDIDEANWKNPVMAANDGASGIAVLLELARLVQTEQPKIGVDFICFDAEDAGTPKWETEFEDTEDTWCLGSQYWAKNPHWRQYRFGILLDMVGGMGAKFYKEGFSQRYANDIVTLVWQAAKEAGYGSSFVEDSGGYITDDHLPVNQRAKIKMIDIIPYYPTAKSGFGPTWHTMQDTPENIDPNTLKAVGQTMVQLIYSLPE